MTAGVLDSRICSVTNHGLTKPTVRLEPSLMCGPAGLVPPAPGV